MDNKQVAVERLEFQVSRGLLVSGMQATQGWKVLEEELKKMIEAYKARAVDPKLIGQPYEHATIVGAHNALRSLLDLLEITKDQGKRASTKLKEIENERDPDEGNLQRI